nr:ATP synthase F0 subunit 6 [Xylophagaidae sp. E23]UPX88977.1 ATP synthase F0 subunit 6 [Xylophagaidae sp. E81]
MSSSLLSHFDYALGTFGGVTAVFFALNSLFFPFFLLNFSGVFLGNSRVESAISVGFKAVGGLVRNQRMNFYSGSVHFIFALVCLVFSLNFMGSFPYLYSLSSHGVVIFSLSLPLWITFSICCFPQNFYYLFGESFSGSHPLAITVMLLISELVSIFARPFTLTLRMCVNVIVGQVMLALLGSKVSYLLFLSPLTFANFFNLTMMGGLMVSMFFVETLVMVIQTGVFVMLLVFFGEDGVLSK